MWEPPDGAEAELPDLIGDRLRALGAREWQVELTAKPLAEAITSS
jgi:ribonuclease D